MKTVKERENTMNLTPRKKVFVDTATKMFGSTAVISKQMIREAATEANIPVPTWFQDQCKVGYNQFKLPGEAAPAVAATTTTESLNTTVNLVASTEIENLVPTKF